MPVQCADRLAPDLAFDELFFERSAQCVSAVAAHAHKSYAARQQFFNRGHADAARPAFLECFLFGHCEMKGAGHFATARVAAAIASEALV